MPHASAHVGNHEVVALCDAVFASEDSTEDSFPPVPEEIWVRMRAEHPETWREDGMWQLHGHCFLVRGGGRTLLFDTGIGPRTAPAFAWSSTEGRLPDDLADAGVEPGEIDIVVISHVHDDHLGWTVGEAGAPMFPNARYLLQRADWDILHGGDPEDLDILRRTLEPLEAAGQLEFLDGDEDIASDLHLRHLPGHTPGHQVLLIDGAGGGTRSDPLMISADTFNHPALFIDPGWWGTSDFEPQAASVVRATMLEDAMAKGWRIATAHFEVPFGRVEREGKGFVWRPDA